MPVEPPSLIDRLAALEAYVVRNDARITVLEADVTKVVDEQPAPADFDRLRWFMKHGRQRPW